VTDPHPRSDWNSAWLLIKHRLKINRRLKRVSALEPAFTVLKLDREQSLPNLIRPRRFRVPAEFSCFHRQTLEDFEGSWF
jgi:hypothetical protein